MITGVNQHCTWNLNHLKGKSKVFTVLIQLWSKLSWSEFSWRSVVQKGVFTSTSIPLLMMSRCLKLRTVQYHNMWALSFAIEERSMWTVGVKAIVSWDRNTRQVGNIAMSGNWQTRIRRDMDTNPNGCAYGQQILCPDGLYQFSSQQKTWLRGWRTGHLCWAMDGLFATRVVPAQCTFYLLISECFVCQLVIIGLYLTTNINLR